MISTEYIQASEKAPRIMMHKTHSTRRCLKGMLKRAFRSQKKNNEYAGWNSHAESSNSRNATEPPRISSLQFLLPSNAQKQPIYNIYRKPVPAGQPSPSSSSSSSGTLPHGSLRGSTTLLQSYPEFHDLLDFSTWPSLPPPTNLSRAPQQFNPWQTPEQLNLMIRRWIDSHDSALPPPDFKHACPIAYHHIRGIMTGDGINDWVTRAAVLAEVDRVRMAMLEATILGQGAGDGRGWDLQALQAVHKAVSRLGAQGESRW